MTLTVREMAGSEIDIIIEYFRGSTPEHLEMLGVDPTRMPDPESWRERLRNEFARPIERRAAIVVIWLLDDRPIGFSTSDKIAMASKPICTCTSLIPSAGIVVMASNACGAVSIFISSD